VWREIELVLPDVPIEDNCAAQIGESDRDETLNGASSAVDCRTMTMRMEPITVHPQKFREQI